MVRRWLKANWRIWRRGWMTLSLWMRCEASRILTCNFYEPLLRINLQGSSSNQQHCASGRVIVPLMDLCKAGGGGGGRDSITRLGDQTPAWAESLLRSPLEHGGPRGRALIPNTVMVLLCYKQLISSSSRGGQTLSGRTGSWGETLQDVVFVPLAPAVFTLFMSHQWEQLLTGALCEQFELKCLHSNDRRLGDKTKLLFFIFVLNLTAVINHTCVLVY